MKLTPTFLPKIASSVAVRIFIAFFAIYAITSSGGLEAIDSEARYQSNRSGMDAFAGRRWAAMVASDGKARC